MVPPSCTQGPGERHTCFLLLLYKTDHKHSGLNHMDAFLVVLEFRHQQWVSLGKSQGVGQAVLSSCNWHRPQAHPTPSAAPYCAPVLLRLIHPWSIFSWGAAPQRSQSPRKSALGALSPQSPLRVRALRHHPGCHLTGELEGKT